MELEIFWNFLVVLRAKLNFCGDPGNGIQRNFLVGLWTNCLNIPFIGGFLFSYPFFCSWRRAD